MEFVTKSGIEGSFNATLSYAAMERVEGIDTKILNPNIDDGDRNFDKGLVSSLVKGTYEFDLHKAYGDTTLGLFNRGLAFYDAKIRNASNDHDSPLTNNGNPIFGGSLDDLNSFTEATQDRAGSDAKLLDLFLYADSVIDDYPISVRLGQQVVNWGENAFIQSGISNAINPADAGQAALPGTEVKEILLPVEQLYGSIGLSQSFSLEGYYQSEWENTIAPAAGTFLSSNDFIAEDGGESLLLPGGAHYRRGANIEPDQGGQWGLALRWYAEQLNDTEFSVYVVNYHSKLPNISLAGTPFPPPGGGAPAVGPGEYRISYFDDIRLYGLSFNTVLWNTAFSGEIAYHEDVPLQTIALDGAAIGAAAALGGAPLSLSTREDMVVTQLTVNRSLKNDPWVGSLADDVAFIAELGLVYTPDLKDGEVFKGPDARDQTAWGYKSRLTLTYYDGFGKLVNALSGTDLIVDLVFNHDVEGSSAIVAGSFEDNAKSAGIGINAVWHNSVEAGLRYNAFFGDSDLSDRDNIALTLKYRI